MRDALAVGGLERPGDLDRDANGLLSAHRTFAQPVRQSLTLDQFHDEIVKPILLADVMQRANVRMVQSGDSLRFALESLIELLL